MRDATTLGPYSDVADAPHPTKHGEHVRVGVRSETFGRITSAWLATVIAQYYGIVQDGLWNAQHLFRGLKRPLMRSDDTRGDRRVLVYTWRPKYDYLWIGSPFNGIPKPMGAPWRRVFVVLVAEHEAPNEQGIMGDIEHWNWVEEDSGLPGAPVNWENRYEEKLWSKP